MKKSIFAWFIAALALGMSACTQESLNLTAEELFNLGGSVNVFCAGKNSVAPNTLPQLAQTYLQQKYADYTIHDVYLFKQDSAVFYGVELKKVGSEKKILFNAKGEVISVGEDNERSAYYLPEKIPANIKIYLDKNFPGIQIKEVEVKQEYGLTAYKIELSNDVKLTFSASGEMWCRSKSGDDNSGSDDDDDDDDDDDNSNGKPNSLSLSDSIKQLIVKKYPGYVAYESEQEDLCEGLIVLKVGIKKGSDELHLMFDKNGKFLFDALRIAANQLPAAVSTTLKNQYPGFTFKDEKSIELLRYPDGTQRYYVRLRSSTGEDLRLMLNAAGTIACKKGSSNSSGGNTTGGNGSSGGNTSGNTNTIKDYVASKYPGYSIYEQEKEDWCEDQYFIEVGLKSGSKEVHLVFDLKEKFLFELNEVGTAGLPAAVSNAIKTLYPGYQIKDEDEVEEHRYPDGSKQYYVRLRKTSGGGGSDVRVLFSADGKVICEKK